MCLVPVRVGAARLEVCRVMLRSRVLLSWMTVHFTWCNLLCLPHLYLNYEKNGKSACCWIHFWQHRSILMFTRLLNLHKLLIFISVLGNGLSSSKSFLSKSFNCKLNPFKFRFLFIIIIIILVFYSQFVVLQDYVISSTSRVTKIMLLKCLCWLASSYLKCAFNSLND